MFDKIGEDRPTYIIAEMSANHAGSIEHALEIVHAAKESGADCIKVQTYTPDTLTINCDNKWFQIRGGLWDRNTLYDLYQKAYMPWEWQGVIKAESEKVGIDFLSTPFDRSSVDFLETLGVSMYKIASFELVDLPFLEYVGKMGKPLIISTGMGSFLEINDAVNTIRGVGNHQICLLKCSSAYPAVAEDMNLATIGHMMQSFRTSVGLSDHSMGFISAVTSVALGASVIEKHFCLSREIKNPDSEFSMEPDEFREMVKTIRETEKAIGHVSYELSEREKESQVFRRSLFAVADIQKGEVFSEINIRSIRPGYGLSPKYFPLIIGKKATRDIPYGTPITLEDLEPGTITS